MKTYFENLSIDTSRFSANRNGMAYLGWAAAIGLAGNPEHAPAMFGDQPYLPVFGGAVVAVDMLGQRIWLPILDERNGPIAVGNINSRDVSDTIQRCRAKAVAMTAGVGMSLYAGFDGDASKFIAELGIDPESDLAKTKAISSKKGGSSSAEYLDWASALAAAKTTDETFSWKVGMYPAVDTESGEIVEKPYLKTVDTYLVSVEVTYKGKAHTEWLPIMGVLPVKTKNGTKKMDHQPLITPNVFDWNRSIMRCLAKAISVVTGYGLSIYAKEDIMNPDGIKPEDVEAPDLTEVRKLLKEANKDEAAMCAWLGVKSLEEADLEAITKAENTLRKALGMPPVKKEDAPAKEPTKAEEAWPI